VALALERWLAPYINEGLPSATSATSATSVAPSSPAECEVAGVAIVARGAPQTTWSDAQEECAAIIEYDGGAPPAWAEGFARLNPNKPPADVPVKRWLRFIDDCARFLDAGWAGKAAALGWGPFHLFGCDRKRPFTRLDNMGLIWFLNGGRIIELHRDRVTIETRMGARQCYRLRPIEVGQVVLAWELAS